MWADVSEEERKALRVLITNRYGGIHNMAKDMRRAPAGLFLKLKGDVKFKKDEYEQILQLLDITEEQLELCSKSYILNLLP